MSADVVKLEEGKVAEISGMIRYVQGVQVMLDRDLATLYGVEVKRLNEQVRRNIERFPDDFCFQLTKEECSRSQIATLNASRGGNIKYLPYVFTESGIAMLSAVLHSPTAIKTNIRIMRAFVAMRHFVAENAGLLQRLGAVEVQQAVMRKELDEVLGRPEEFRPREKLFVDGQQFDAYTQMRKIVSSAKHDILLIDGYVDEKTLDVLAARKDGVQIRIITNPKTRLSENAIECFNKQYGGLVVDYAVNFHDRFLAIDDDVVYHVGGSIKDLGRQTVELLTTKLLTAGELASKAKLTLRNKGNLLQDHNMA